jgi:hypothetical protein
MGHDGCLKKAMGLSKTDQGVKNVLKMFPKKKMKKLILPFFPL